jgi:hypothetical protein
LLRRTIQTRIVSRKEPASAELKGNEKSWRSFRKKKHNGVDDEKEYFCFFVVDRCPVIGSKPDILPNAPAKGNPQLFEQRDYLH